MSNSKTGGCKKRSRKGKGYYLTYANAGQREKNKARKLMRHLKRKKGGNDKQSVRVLEALTGRRAV